MIVSTTNTVEGKKIQEYVGIATGSAILGANVVKDIFSGFRDVFGGRSKAYEKELEKARMIALEEAMENAKEKGANALIGVDFDYESVRGTMMMVSVSGTAVKLSE